jgi:signal transduction histidine kinase
VRQLASALTLSEQQERRQLARELHDSAGQLLTALQIYLKLIEQEVPEELEALREKMADAVKMVQEAQQEVRAVSHAMRPSALDQLGLRVALEELSHDFARRTGRSVTYQSDELPPLDDHVSLNFYRFLQEALNNAARHSQARSIQVVMSYLDGELTLMVEDDGVGFDVQKVLSATASETGMGLHGLQERFYLLGGQVEIDSQPGRGTRLVARRVLTR